MYKTPENKFKTSSKFSSTKKDYYGKSATQPTVLLLIIHFSKIEIIFCCHIC